MEGQSISIIETLAMGLPVIATDAGAASLIVENEYNGFIIEKKNIDQFVLRANTLLDDHELIRIISQRNIERYKKNFSDEIFCQSMQNLFDSYI
jgi:glycosyltransferase involved in cell wall biosynthesis